MDQLKSQVINSFTKIRNALDLREKLLLRQIEVLSKAPEKNKIDFCEITFQTEAEENVLEILRKYGTLHNIDNYLPYLENENEDMGLPFEKSFSFDPSTVDNKKLSESIVNFTFAESQNLIHHCSDLVTSVCNKLNMEPPRLRYQDNSSSIIDKTSDPPLGNELQSIKLENDVKVKQPDEGKLKRNDTTTSSKKKTLKNISNLTLNNCNGNIVLKNISNLTINTCKQPEFSSKVDDAPPKSCKTSKSCDGSFYQCDFYERLISENEVLKRSIVKQSLCTTYTDPIATTCFSPPASTAAKNKGGDDGTYSITSTADDTTTSSIMEEAEDGLSSKRDKAEVFDPTIEEITTKTMLNDNLLNHPPMIQCWLNKMLLETETESQNITELLEVSNII